MGDAYLETKFLNSRLLIRVFSAVKINLFKREVMQKRYIALALNCELYNDETNNIGAKIIGSSSEGKKKSKKVENYTHGDKKLYGAAIAWESNIAYYISFSNEQGI